MPARVGDHYERGAGGRGQVLAQLHCLQTLDLEENDLGNPVTANWGSATSWTALKCLNIASCCLTEIPRSLLSLTSLRILDVTNNLCAPVPFVCVCARVTQAFLFPAWGGEEAQFRVTRCRGRCI